MVKKEPKSSRRKLLQSLGAGAASVPLLSGSSLAKSNGTISAETEDKKPSRDSNDWEIEPQWMKGSTTSFSPTGVSAGEKSTLSSSWSFQGILSPINTYQLDILVETDNARKPETVSIDVPENWISKDWEYKSNSPIGSAWHWQADIITADILGTSANIQAEVETKSGSQDVTAKTGTYWPYQQWSTAWLQVD